MAYGLPSVSGVGPMLMALEHVSDFLLTLQQKYSVSGYVLLS